MQRTLQRPLQRSTGVGMETIDGGTVVGFVAAHYGTIFAIVRFGNRLLAQPLEDVRLRDSLDAHDDLVEEAVQVLEERELAWSDGSVGCQCRWWLSEQGTAARFEPSAECPIHRIQAERIARR